MSVGAGGAVTGDPFVEIVAQVRAVWAGRVLGPGREGASIRKVVTTATGLTKDGLWQARKRIQVKLDISLRGCGRPGA